MRRLLLLAGAALCVVSSAHAAGVKQPAFDPVHNPTLNATEQVVYEGFAALATIVTTGCANVPWRVSSSFQRGLAMWRLENGVSEERASFIVNKVSDDRARVPCDRIAETMARISQNWIGKR
jgi:hypothetical protein